MLHSILYVAILVFVFLVFCFVINLTIKYKKLSKYIKNEMTNKNNQSYKIQASNFLSETYEKLTNLMTIIREIDLLKQKHAELPTKFSNYCKTGEEYKYFETLNIQRKQYIQLLKFYKAAFLENYKHIRHYYSKDVQVMYDDLLDDVTRFLVLENLNSKE